MRADVDALAAKPEPLDAKIYHVQRPDDGAMKIRLRKLHIGETRQRGDLWLGEDGRLIPLALRPWWRRLFGYGVVANTHADHFRVLV